MRLIDRLSGLVRTVVLLPKQPPYGPLYCRPSSAHQCLCHCSSTLSKRKFGHVVCTGLGGPEGWTRLLGSSTLCYLPVFSMVDKDFLFATCFCAFRNGSNNFGTLGGGAAILPATPVNRLFLITAIFWYVVQREVLPERRPQPIDLAQTIVANHYALGIE